MSVCDSLAGIDDLDAYLDSQPALSHFPTPPLNDSHSTLTHFIECLDEPDTLEYSYIAETLASDADAGEALSSADVDDVYSFLRHAQLPLEILAIASNILSGFCVNADATRMSVCGQSCRALTVVAALSLALSYSSDHAPNSSWWSKHVCQGRWSAADVDRTALGMFAALDWSLHRYTDLEKIGQAMTKLSAGARYGSPSLPVASMEKLPILVQAISVESSG